jgi:hypothetical protein
VERYEDVYRNANTQAWQNVEKEMAGDGGRMSELENLVAPEEEIKEAIRTEHENLM